VGLIYCWMTLVEPVDPPTGMIGDRENDIFLFI